MSTKFHGEASLAGINNTALTKPGPVGQMYNTPCISQPSIYCVGLHFRRTKLSWFSWFWKRIVSSASILCKVLRIIWNDSHVPRIVSLNDD